MERKDFVDRLKQKIDEWNNDIDHLEKQLQNASQHARIETEEKMAELRRYRDEAQARLDEARAQGEATWQAARARTEAAWSTLNENFRKVLDGARGGLGR